jgi:5'-nucleotidase
VLELCPERPDLIVSGINAGSNSGIDVLYSGTVAAAIEGAFFGITSVAVSLVADSNPDYDTAARWGAKVIRELLDKGIPEGSLWNVNVPDSRPGWPLGVRVVPISVERGRDVMIPRVDPRGRTYYWAATDDTWKPPHAADSDVEGLAEGYVTVTPLQFNLTHRPLLHAWREHRWTASLDAGNGSR